MNYNFDEIIDRKGTDALNYDGWRQYIFKEKANMSFPFKDSEYIRMWLADMDFSTPPEILNAVRERLDRKILGYTKIYDQGYFDDYRDWCLRRYNWKIDTNDIVISPGIIPALNRLVPLLTENDERILITTPSYAPFKGAGDYNEREVIYSKLLCNDGHYSMDFEDIERKLDDPSLNIKLFIFCNPHNPTGRIWTESELKRFGEICLKRGIWIISDEIHCDLLRSGKKHTPLAKCFPESDKVITCMAPSKTFNVAGNLMSHLFIKNEAIKAEWLKWYDEFISPLSLVATRAAFSKCDDWLDSLKVYLDDNFKLVADFIKQELPKINFTIPESTYLAWINVEPYLKPDVDREQLSLYFATHAPILVEGGNMFVDNGDGHIRINLACPRSVIEQGLKHIRSVLLK